MADETPAPGPNATPDDATSGGGTTRRRLLSVGSLGAAAAAGFGGALMLPGERAVEAARAGVSAAGAQIVFDPEATAGGNVCTTWSQVVEAIAATEGPHDIAVARNASAEPGTWDLGAGIVTFRSMPGRDWFLGGPTLTIPPGCVFDPPPPVIMLDAGILFLSESDRPVMTHYARKGAPLMSTCLIATRGGAFAATKHPILYVDNYDEHDPPGLVFTTPIPMVAAVVVLDQGRFLNGPDGEDNVDEGASPIVEVAGCVLAVNLGPGVAMMTDEVFTGEGQLYYFVNSTAVPRTDIKNSTFSGPEVWTLVTRAGALGFTAGDAAAWNEPAAPPTTAQAAIDELAARVSALEKGV